MRALRRDAEAAEKSHVRVSQASVVSGDLIAAHRPAGLRERCSGRGQASVAAVEHRRAGSPVRSCAAPETGRPPLMISEATGGSSVALGRSVEHALLLALARTRVDGAQDREIRSLLQRAVDWDHFLQLAHAHQVAALVGYNLCARYAQECPAAVIAQLRLLLQQNTTHNLFLAHELNNLLAQFAAHSVRAIPYKGPMLAAQVHGHPGLRSFADLDVMVHKWDYHFRVPQFLYARGWSLKADHGYERMFRDGGRRVRLDVHQELTSRRAMPVALDFDAVWRRCVEVPLLGQPVRTFAPADLLLVLCVQLAKDMAEDAKAPQLMKICDIAETVRTFPATAWKPLLRDAARVGVLRMVYLGLCIARRLLGAPLPPEVARAIAGTPRLASLVRHVEECVLNENGGQVSRPELLTSARWHHELRERARERHRLLRPLLYLALVPNRYDYEFVRLPRALHALYGLVRPVRLACKYGGRMMVRLPGHGRGARGSEGRS
jgi:hypothetical protein